jgi:hypothetical protein
MKKIIVSTTINPPTEAIHRFDAMPDWTLVVIGDKKTPAGYKLDRGIYVTAEETEKYDRALSDAIGSNCIQRRNFGLLWAHDMKADVVAVVDDDNIPQAGWGENLLVGREIEANYFETDLPAFDPVGATNHKNIWHRGFPLELIPKRDYSRKSTRKLIPDVQADFWDGDPDIDAICRMEHRPECKFDSSAFPIASNKMGPFNSQNTFLSAKLLKDYFLFPHTGRMDDIWASYYVQGLGAKVVWAKASVYQDRNIHNPIRDMKAEYIGYENNLELVSNVAKDPASIVQYLPGKSVEAFRLFQKHFN